MLKYYLKTSWRSVLANKTYTFLNIGGLALGLAAFLLIGLFVYDELSHDSFHQHKDQIYRVVSDATWPTSPTSSVALTPRPLGDVLQDYPGVEYAVRLVPFSPTISYGARHFRDIDTFYAEHSFFELFSFPLTDGDPATALSEPYSAVISESIERLFFQGESALGKEVTFNNAFTVTVTGVAEDPPHNSHVSFDVLVSYATHELLRPAPVEPQWLELNMYTYLLLDARTDMEEFSNILQNLPQEHYGSVLQQYGVSMDLHLQPLTDIYLHSRRDAEIGRTGDHRLVLAATTIAFLILLIACINYINLATARSVNRAKEVGVRKVLGADRIMLVRQSLTTSIVTVALAMFIAFALLRAVLPLFNEWADKDFTIAAFLSPLVLVSVAALVTGVGLFAGAYPAVVLSRYKPAPILRGTFSSSAQGIRLRKGLVVVQFAISIALIIGTLVITHQVDHIRSQSLGFNAEHLMMIDARGIHTGEFTSRLESIKNELTQLPSVQRASASSSSPGRELPLLLIVTEGMDEGESRRSHILSIDHDYVATYGIEVIAGRSLSEEYESDVTEAALINERSVSTLGWATPEEALGKWIQFGAEQRNIVGVVADYHHLSLHRELEPMKMLYLPNWFNTITVSLQSDNTSAAVLDIRGVWERHFPGHTFMYSFVDEQIDQQYRSDLQLATVTAGFAGLAITLACLGLFGLSVHAVQQRRREIGIRKVVGASPSSIFGILSKDVIKLVFVGFCIGAPVAYLAMNQWLDAFAHRVTVGPGIIAIGGIAALIIALLTVSFQALKGAWMNPTDAIEQT